MIAKRALDDWLDGAIDGALFSGDPEALNILKEARSARLEYGKRFGLTGPRDDAGKFVRKLLDQSTTPEEIARGIFGAARAYPQSATRIVTRLEGIFGADSAEMAAVREMGWMKINSDAIEESLKSGVVVQRLSALGYEPLGGSADQFAATIKADIVKYAGIVKAAGIKVGL